MGWPDLFNEMVNPENYTNHCAVLYCMHHLLVKEKQGTRSCTSQFGVWWFFPGYVSHITVVFIAKEQEQLC